MQAGSPCPIPTNLDHHFVVDPTKYDFYAMDCYRQFAEDHLAETLANIPTKPNTGKLMSTME
jgi:hypothetical protein